MNAWLVHNFTFLGGPWRPISELDAGSGGYCPGRHIFSVETGVLGRPPHCAWAMPLVINPRISTFPFVGFLACRTQHRELKGQCLEDDHIAGDPGRNRPPENRTFDHDVGQELPP
jgi:hypothetical protein